MWGGGGPGPGANNGPWTQQQQWSFNPNSYVNLAHDQVDWAALAQQWIQMKDITTQQGQPQVNISPFEQQQPLYSTPPPFSGGPGFQNNLLNQPDTWAAPPISHQRHSADVNEDWNDKHDMFPPLDSQYNAMFQQQPPHHQQSQRQPPPSEESHWNSPMSGSQKFSQAPSKHDSYDTSHHQQQQHHQHHHHHHDMSRSHQELDAIRRKQLPAWIREGLEKVDREKRRKQEKEEQDALKEQMREANKAMLSKQVDAEGVPVVSKWTAPVVPTGDSDEELQEDDKKPPVKLKQKKESLEDRVKAFLTTLNNEENLDQLMLCVRRQLTKLLLTGTNEMMRTIAQETLERFKRKASQVKKTKAVASLKSELGTFGLTSYGGSDSEEENSEEDSAPELNANDDDDESSEEDIRIEMEKKKRTFQLMLLRKSSSNGQDEEAPTAASSSSTEMSNKLTTDREVTSGDNNKVRDEEPSSRSSSSSIHPRATDNVENGNDDEKRSDDKLQSGSSGGGRKTDSLSNSPHRKHRSRSHHRSRDRYKSSSSSRRDEKTKHRSSHSRKSRSRSRSRRRQKKRSKKSRSSSRDRKKNKKRSRSKSRERKKHHRK